MKRSPLKPGNKPLKSSKPLQSRSQLKPGKGLKPRSDATVKKYREERVPLVKRLLKERPWCEACALYAEHDGLEVYRCRPSSDLHEKLSRGATGGVKSDEWLDPENILCICRPCHNRIDRDKDLAERLGLRIRG